MKTKNNKLKPLHPRKLSGSVLRTTAQALAHAKRISVVYYSEEKLIVTDGLNCNVGTTTDKKFKTKGAEQAIEQPGFIFVNN